jgi:biotin-(acetyl-CoA carboxylase) ligase
MKQPNPHSTAFRYLLAKEIPKVFDQVLKDPAFDGIKDRAGKRSLELTCYVELWEFAQDNVKRIAQEIQDDPKRSLEYVRELMCHPANRKDST